MRNEGDDGYGAADITASVNLTIGVPLPRIFQIRMLDGTIYRIFV